MTATPRSNFVPIKALKIIRLRDGKITTCQRTRAAKKLRNRSADLMRVRAVTYGFRKMLPAKDAKLKALLFVAGENFTTFRNVEIVAFEESSDPDESIRFPSCIREINSHVAENESLSASLANLFR